MSDLDSGWAALREGRWKDARAIFDDAVRDAPSAEAHEGVSWAAWWLDDPDAMFAARERAFRLYEERGDGASAARMATWMAADQIDFNGALSVASGWLDRARRLLDPLEEGPDHGWWCMHRSYLALIKGETEVATTEGARAAELGRRFSVPDLEMLGLAIEGATLVSQARVEDGMRCLDEASVIALSSEASIPISRAWTFCFLVTACTRVFDVERAFEWCDRIADFAERYDNDYMLGFCRAEYATVHMWRGEWEAAERALVESISALTSARPPMVSGPKAQLAELRRRQGRLDETERLLEEVGTSSRARLCRAELALARGDHARAVDLAERVRRSVSDERPLDRVPALSVLIPAQLASGDLEGAAASIATLGELADRVGTTALSARVDLSRGRLATARGEHAAAKPRLEDALDAFERCGARYEAALARLDLAEILGALGRPGDAEREKSAAHNVLGALGAEAATAPSEAPTPDEAPSPVSKRETEVLALLAEGLTNREISGRLFISEHTVHRHVTNILRKLDVRSRAAAAAWGIRAGIIDATGE